MTAKRRDDFLTQDGMIFFRLQRKLVKIKFFSWKLQNQFFLNMQLKTNSLLKSLPREKLDSFHVPEIHSPLCLRPQPWAN